MCEPWNPPDGGWDPMVVGGPLLIDHIPDGDDTWFPDTEGERDD